MPFSSQGNTLSESEVHPYSSRVIISSPEIDKKVPLPIAPQLQKPPRVLLHRVAAMFNVLVGYLCLVLSSFISIGQSQTNSLHW